MQHCGLAWGHHMENAVQCISAACALMELICNTLDEVRRKCMGDMLWTVATVCQDKLIYDMGVYDNKGLRLKQDCMLYLQHTWRQKSCLLPV